MPTPLPPLVLASGSRYRAELLGRLQLPFRAEAPEVDEVARPGETPLALARRLAEEKAAAVAARFPQACVIGSDQTADCAGQCLGKPGTLAAARAQLSAMSGQTVVFQTAVTVRLGMRQQRFVEPTTVRLRALTPAEIERYLALEPALDCAGSFKCEGLGISLFESLDSRDPTALIGLPLIRLAAALRTLGYPV